ncbi:uncharacterized protein LOC116846250 isoform X2 [Odontomachus brunneus]|uniref:uncharacterized protein LOC116846250 isoform X2 n=1 Tax=Odontomachus brunneus TaxID=486640 RepID=UPI0013F2749D|nr:uncharacterized protein LOC116846250 isoform X2 [Odontomachus brunneus]
MATFKEKALTNFVRSVAIAVENLCLTLSDEFDQMHELSRTLHHLMQEQHDSRSKRKRMKYAPSFSNDEGEQRPTRVARRATAMRATAVMTSVDPDTAVTMNADTMNVDTETATLEVETSDKCVGLDEPISVVSTTEVCVGTEEEPISMVNITEVCVGIEEEPISVVNTEADVGTEEEPYATITVVNTELSTSNCPPQQSCTSIEQSTATEVVSDTAVGVVDQGYTTTSATFAQLPQQQQQPLQQQQQPLQQQQQPLQQQQQPIVLSQKNNASLLYIDEQASFPWIDDTSSSSTSQSLFAKCLTLREFQRVTLISITPYMMKSKVIITEKDKYLVMQKIQELTINCHNNVVKVQNRGRLASKIKSILDKLKYIIAQPEYTTLKFIACLFMNINKEFAFLEFQGSDQAQSKLQEFLCDKLNCQSKSWKSLHSTHETVEKIIHRRSINDVIVKHYYSNNKFIYYHIPTTFQAIVQCDSMKRRSSGWQYNVSVLLNNKHKDVGRVPKTDNLNNSHKMCSESHKVTFKEPFLLRIEYRDFDGYRFTGSRSLGAAAANKSISHYKDLLPDKMYQ